MSSDETQAFRPAPRQAGSNTEALGHEQRLHEVIAEYLRAVQAGEEPDRQEWMARHAGLAADLAFVEAVLADPTAFIRNPGE